MVLDLPQIWVLLTKSKSSNKLLISPILLTSILNGSGKQNLIGSIYQINLLFLRTFSAAEICCLKLY